MCKKIVFKKFFFMYYWCKICVEEKFGHSHDEGKNTESPDVRGRSDAVTL